MNEKTLIDVSAYREKFLDNFPLSETEVDRLILLYASICEEATTSLANLQATTSSSGPEEEEWWSKLKHVEDTILPDIWQWITREAPQLVSPLLPFDIPDDPSSPLCRAFYFLEALVSLMGRRGTRFLTSFVYEMATKKNGDEGANPEALVNMMYKHLMAALYLQGEKVTLESSDPPKAWILSLLKSAGSATTISKSAWASWINDVMTESMRGLSTFYQLALLGPPGLVPKGPNSPPPLTLPHPDQDPLFWDSNNLLLPLSLTCISPVFTGQWHRLYSRDTDGSSFLTFHQALLSYSGPTALLIRPKGSSVVFGYYTGCPWRHSPTWQGGDEHDSFLFQVSEESLGVYWPTYTGACYMYLNTAPLHNNGMNGANSNTLRGLAIGGLNCETPRVHLTPSLENCKATSTDTTYTSGPLLDEDTSFFNVDALEVWAVNVTQEEFQENQAAGRAQLARKEQARQNFAKVDRAQFLDDFQSGAYMNNLYGHREQARGRHDFVASATGTGYFLEGKPPSVRNLEEHAVSKRKSRRKSGDISMDALPPSVRHHQDEQERK